MNKKDFQERHPSAFYLDAADPWSLQSYMQRIGWLDARESIETAAKAGEGNMNCTVRVRTNTRTLIIKQARPWVEKYPAIPAPWDRALFEASFYETVTHTPEVSSMMPRFLGVDRVSRVLLLEDLSECYDLTSLYGGETLNAAEIRNLAHYLAALHEIKIVEPSRFSNQSMRELNHEHIFHFPILENNGLDLDSFTLGLLNASLPFKRDQRFVARVAELGRLYQSPGGTILLHGDFYPGSWLKTSKGIYVIDPEFGFAGPAEFDLGVMLAHLILTKQSSRMRESLFETYRSFRTGVSQNLVVQFTGVEIMRRLLGVAQLPLRLDLAEKINLLEEARGMVLTPQEEF